MKELLKAVENNTLISPGKLIALRDALYSLKIPGDVIEVGVWQGGSGAVLASIGRPTYLCDTFKGVVNKTHHDPNYIEGEHDDTSPEIVQGLLDSLGFENAVLIQGTFPQSTKEIEDKHFCFAHIDCDVYKSTLESALWIWPRLNYGGMIYFDDYEFGRTPGVTKAVNELAGLFNVLIGRDEGFAVFKKVNNETGF